PLKSAAELDRHNASDRMRREHAEENGAVKYPVDGNGVQGKGAELAKAYTEGKIVAPAGHMLQFTTEYNYEGLHHDITKGRWVDDQTDEPVNMATRTCPARLHEEVEHLHRRADSESIPRPVL